MRRKLAHFLQTIAIARGVLAIPLEKFGASKKVQAAPELEGLGAALETGEEVAGLCPSNMRTKDSLVCTCLVTARIGM